MAARRGDRAAIERHVPDARRQDFARPGQQQCHIEAGEPAPQALASALPSSGIVASQLHSRIFLPPSSMKSPAPRLNGAAQAWHYSGKAPLRSSAKMKRGNAVFRLFCAAAILILAA